MGLIPAFLEVSAWVGLKERKLWGWVRNSSEGTSRFALEVFVVVHVYSQYIFSFFSKVSQSVGPWLLRENSLDYKGVYGHT